MRTFIVRLELLTALAAALAIDAPGAPRTAQHPAAGTSSPGRPDLTPEES